MGLRVVAHVDDRFEDRLAAFPRGWVTASPRALISWDATVPAEPVLSDEPLAGPLAWLSGPAMIGWGPVALAGERAEWTVGALIGIALTDVGDGAGRVFDLTIGAVAGDGGLVFAGFERRQSRVRGAPTVDDTTRAAIIDPRAGRLVESIDGPLPTCVLWGDGQLVLGHPGRIAVRDDHGVWSTFDLETSTVPRSIATGPGGVVAGTASGDVVRFDPDGSRAAAWAAHRGPVTALTAAGDLELIVTGGSDGRILRWEGGTCRGEVQAGGPVAALAGPVDQHVAALVGGAGGRAFVLLEL